jgi:hypothetical protein
MKILPKYLQSNPLETRKVHDLPEKANGCSVLVGQQLHFKMPGILKGTKQIYRNGSQKHNLY